MDFKEFVEQELHLAKSTSKDYDWRVERVFKDYNYKNGITLTDIDNLINLVRNNISYVGTHGNIYASALERYKEYLIYINCQSKTKNNQVNCPINPQNELGNIFNPNYFPETGADNNCQNVYYDRNILDDEKIPGLCMFLANEYESALGYGRKLFDSELKVFGSILAEEFIRIPVILKKETPHETYHNDIQKMLKIRNNLNGKLTNDDVDEIFAKKDFDCAIAGEYYTNASRTETCIVIYYKNIKANNYEEYLSAISKTLAHEIMHYIHDTIVGFAMYENTYSSEIVKESIADFFSVMYLLQDLPYKRTENANNANSIVANSTYNSWLKNLGSTWPYAFALYFMSNVNNFYPFSEDYNYYVKNECIDKLKKLVELSGVRLDVAFDEIFEDMRKFKVF